MTSLAAAAVGAEIIVNATCGLTSIDALREVGGAALAGAVLMYLPRWLRIMQSLGAGTFNVKVVREP